MIAPTEELKQLIERAEKHLRGIIETGGLDAEVSLLSQENEDITLSINGPDANLLVGPHGQTLDALQYLLLVMTNKQRDQRLRITVDADGYRQRRIEKLTTFANSLADQVVSTGQEAITDPLNAMERRIIHTALVDHPGVQTYSEGDDPNRYVVISPRVSDDEPASA